MNKSLTYFLFKKWETMFSSASLALSMFLMINLSIQYNFSASYCTVSFSLAFNLPPDRSFIYASVWWNNVIILGYINSDKVLNKFSFILFFSSIVVTLVYFMGQKIMFDSFLDFQSYFTSGNYLPEYLAASDSHNGVKNSKH